MKKNLLLVAAVITSAASFAQKQNIQTASNYLKDKDYDKAVEYINMATNDPSTKDSPKAWYMRGHIFMSIQADTTLKKPNSYKEAATSLIKTIELDAKYEKETVDQYLHYCASMYYNESANAFNDKRYEDAIASSKKVADIYNIDGGKRFSSNKQFEKLASDALLVQGMSTYNAGKYEEALPLLNALKSNAATSTPNIYLMIADAYRKQNKDAEMLATLEEGRAKYPNDQNIQNEELNYYIKQNKQDVLIKKLEEAVAKDSKNADLYFNLGTTYFAMAMPKDQPKPANSAELVSKAEAAYAQALSLDANNAGYNYNIGVMYFNSGSELITQMNTEADLADAAKGPEKKKHEDAYDKLKLQRDALFAKSMPYFEKVSSLLEPKLKTLNREDMGSYRGALTALKEIYARQNNLPKADEMKKKLEDSRK
ncbi:MAG: tetratricopeptide repeat protein [Bacteroidetes bacterium]|nr:tetratricopeptide repeat protein [Bacteroidota bacterium]